MRYLPILSDALPASVESTGAVTPGSIMSRALEGKADP